MTNLNEQQLGILISCVFQKEFKAIKESLTTTPKFLTRDEVCKMLNVSKTCLHNWKRNGTLRPVGIGNRVLYKYEDVISSVKYI